MNEAAYLHDDKRKSSLINSPQKSDFISKNPKDFLTDFATDNQMEIQNYEKNLMIDDITCVICYFKK